MLYPSVDMTTLLPIASGKGGVGKTIFAANLGVSLAQHGKTVILIDLDMGGSNLHTCLGVKNRNPGIGSYIFKKESSLESLTIQTDIKQLFFIPGDSLLPGTANLPYFMKKKIIKEISELIADYVIIDLASGTGYNIIDFFLTSMSGIIITVPQTTAILNAYSFLKTSIFRLLYRSFPAKSRERAFILEFVSNRIEGTESTFLRLTEQLFEISKESGEIAKKQLEAFYPRIVLNMGHSHKELSLGSKLRQIAGKNLNLRLEYIGFLGYEEMVNKSVFERIPIRITHPNSGFSNSIDMISRKLISTPAPVKPQLFEADEDLLSLAEEIQQGYINQ
ncbi:MAG: P-loop NTPase [Spirochaetota bacterium]